MKKIFTLILFLFLLSNLNANMDRQTKKYIKNNYARFENRIYLNFFLIKIASSFERCFLA